MRYEYYEGNTCYYMSNKEYRRILRRIRSTCNIIIGICLFMLVGIVGSVDIGKTSLAEFFIYETINICVLLVSAWVRINV